MDGRFAIDTGAVPIPPHSRLTANRLPTMNR
jgi:hypothetical protein